MSGQGAASRYREALGLVDWRARADGPLAAARPQADADAPLPQHAERVQDDAAGRGERESTVTRDVRSAEPADSAPPLADEPPPPTDEDIPLPDDADIAPQMSLEPGPGAPTRSPTADMSWEQLEAWLGEQDHRGARQPVFGTGARDADVLIVGEAPGANEDAQGLPFVGRAGKLLDRMLFAIGCSRETNVYITNICKFRPPNNRDPNPEEVAADWPVLERQIELMNPKLVVAVGRVAAQTLLDSTESLGRMRGRLHKYPRRELDVLVTYHPAYLLRSPQQKAAAWTDLRRIAAHIARAGQAA